LKLLVDTHAYLWWLSDDAKLRDEARAAMADAASLVYVSAATIWEIAIKVELGKLEITGDPVAEIEANGFVELPMTARHAELAGRLPKHHEDPFDRMLIAQAKLEKLVLVSRDGVFTAYGVPILPA